MAEGTGGAVGNSLILSQGYGVIPNMVLFDNSLTDKQKLLFCLISSLCAEKGFCWASNKFLGDKLGVKERTISNGIKCLTEKGYLESDVNQSKGNERRITIGNVINHTTSCEKSQDPSCEKSQHNITSINITKEKTSSKEVEQSSKGNPDINNLISEIKQMCLGLGVAYDKQKERQFAKHILTAKEYGNFCEQVGQDRVTFALNVLKASFQIKFRKGICTGPMKIYQNYADVYNETLKQHAKQSKNLIQSF